MEKEANEKQLEGLIHHKTECLSIKANNARDIEVKCGSGFDSLMHEI